MKDYKVKQTVVLAAGAVILLFLGIIYIWSVFQRPVMEFYSWDVGSASVTSSVMLGFFVFGILLGGRVQDKIGATYVVLAGGLLLSVSMLLTSFVPAGLPALIYLTYAIIGGFGVGCAYNATISTVQKWFVTNRGFATGVAVCAFGFSTVVFAPVVDSLIKSYGLQNTFRLLSGAFFILIILLYRFIKAPEQATASGGAAVTKKQYTSKEMLKTKQFYLITLSLMLGTPAFFMLNPLLKIMGTDRGLSDGLALAGVMITGVASASGRLIAPIISDKIGREKAILLLLSITALCAALLVFVQGASFIAAIAFVAFSYGGYSGVFPVITADYFGVKNLGANYGYVMVGFGLSALIFPNISGVIMRTNPNSPLPFIISLALCILGVIFVLMLKKGKTE